MNEHVAADAQLKFSDKALQMYLCVWHDTGRYQSVARREAPVPVATLLEAPVLPSTPPFEAPRVIWARLHNKWDLLNASNRVAEEVQKRVRA